jgi:hypothetical protein
MATAGSQIMLVLRPMTPPALVIRHLLLIVLALATVSAFAWR